VPRPVPFSHFGLGDLVPPRRVSSNDTFGLHEHGWYSLGNRRVGNLRELLADHAYSCFKACGVIYRVRRVRTVQEQFNQIQDLYDVRLWVPTVRLLKWSKADYAFTFWTRRLYVGMTDRRLPFNLGRKQRVEQGSTLTGPVLKAYLHRMQLLVSGLQVSLPDREVAFLGRNDCARRGILLHG